MAIVAGFIPRPTSRRSKGSSAAASSRTWMRWAAVRWRRFRSCWRSCRFARTMKSRRHRWMSRSGSPPCPSGQPSTMPDGDAAPQQLFDRFHRWLRERHLPITRQRDMVARAVFAGGEHLSVVGIQRRLREQGLRVGTATVYRSLDVLLESGLVRANDFGEGFKRFEALLSPG